MEIKTLKIFNFVIFILIFGITTELSSNDNISLSSNKLKNVIEDTKINKKNLILKDPLSDITVHLNHILYYPNNLKIENNIENLDFNYPGSLLRNELLLDDDQYFLIETKDKRKLIFNGSLLIQFNYLPSFESYASMNGLTFVKELPDINTAIFKVNNFLDLIIVINNLKEDPAIKSIELNTINPNIKPK